MKKKVHPDSAALDSPKPPLSAEAERRAPSPAPKMAAPAVMTVWRKSLLFNCDGFTVFDANGNLVYRVDKYVKSGKRDEVELMDAAGNSLLTSRRKKLSIGQHWHIYGGEESASPRFSVRKHVSFLPSTSLARVFRCATSPPASVGDGLDASGGFYEVKGSYSRRCCVVYDEGRRPMAEIRRKKAEGGVAYGLDVFRLLVQPGFDAAIAMAVVIVLEEMFGSKRTIIKGFGFRLF